MLNVLVDKLCSQAVVQTRLSLRCTAVMKIKWFIMLHRTQLLEKLYLGEYSPLRSGQGGNEFRVLSRVVAYGDLSNKNNPFIRINCHPGSVNGWLRR